jgi:hypothetical protein
MGRTGMPSSRSRSPWETNSSTSNSAHLAPDLNGRACFFFIYMDQSPIPFIKYQT